MSSTNDETSVNDALLELIRSRKPSNQMNFCKGCYKPNNSLTVRQNIGLVWDRDEISDQGYARYVKIKCKFCMEWRQLSLGSVSIRHFRANFEDATHFILIKDHDKRKGCTKSEMEAGCCYNTLANINELIGTDNKASQQLIKLSDEILEKRKEEMASS